MNFENTLHLWFRLIDYSIHWNKKCPANVFICQVPVYTIFVGDIYKFVCFFYILIPRKAAQTDGQTDGKANRWTPVQNKNNMSLAWDMIIRASSYASSFDVIMFISIKKIKWFTRFVLITQLMRISIRKCFSSIYRLINAC